MRIIILLIISMGLFLSCGNGKKLPNVGDKVYVVQECLSAVSEDDFAELNKVCNRQMTCVFAMSTQIQKEYNLCEITHVNSTV